MIKQTHVYTSVYSAKWFVIDGVAQYYLGLYLAGSQFVGI